MKLRYLERICGLVVLSTGFLSPQDVGFLSHTFTKFNNNSPFYTGFNIRLDSYRFSLYSEDGCIPPYSLPPVTPRGRGLSLGIVKNKCIVAGSREFEAKSTSTTELRISLNRVILSLILWKRNRQQ
jgi:hypothetical protein